MEEETTIGDTIEDAIIENEDGFAVEIGGLLFWISKNPLI